MKTAVLRAISGAIDDTTPIVSNTSGIPVDELADAVDAPERMVVVHFMNPAYLHDTVELVSGLRTKDSALATVRDLLVQLSVNAIHVGDRPGFVVNSLLQPMIMAAIRLFDAGVADVEEIDDAVTKCLGHATGPLRTADLIGLDNVADTGVELVKRTGDPAFEPPPLLLAKIAAGELGRKSGRGFYDYGDAQ
jgi:methoxymalonate biosynthesis protein